MYGERKSCSVLNVFYQWEFETKFHRLFFSISRYTGELSKKARAVTAIDFMESFVAKNKEMNGHRGNCTIMQADATQYQHPKERWNFAFR